MKKNSLFLKQFAFSSGNLENGYVSHTLDFQNPFSQYPDGEGVFKLGRHLGSFSDAGLSEM